MLPSNRPDRCRLLQAAALALLLSWGAEGQAEPAAGTVQEIKGNAFADANGDHRTLDRESPIFVRDQVATGAAARLTARLGRDTTLRLGEQVRLVIDRFLVDAGGELTLEAGALLFDRPAGSPPARVEIRSPYGLIAVRGTRFFAGPSQGAFGVFVERGSVTVQSGGHRVALRPGEGTTIARPGGRPGKIARWKPMRIQEALDSVE